MLNLLNYKILYISQFFDKSKLFFIGILIITITISKRVWRIGFIKSNDNTRQIINF